MNREEFNKIVDIRCNTIKKVLVDKAKEYANDLDVLHNFNRASEISGQSRERSLDGFMLKHYTSYRDIIDKIDQNILPSRELLNEKVTDIINYMILFEGCIIDRINANEERQQKSS